MIFEDIEIALELYQKSLTLGYKDGLKIVDIKNKAKIIIEQDRILDINYRPIFIFNFIPRDQETFKKVIKLFINIYKANKNDERIIRSIYNFRDDIYYFE